MPRSRRLSTKRHSESNDMDTTTKLEGRKFDGDKPDFSLMPPHAIEMVADVLTVGAKKYDRHNWKKLKDGKDRYFAASQRHLWALLRDEKHDPETGIHHAAHAIASLMFYIELDYVQTDQTSV